MCYDVMDISIQIYKIIFHSFWVIRDFMHVNIILDVSVYTYTPHQSFANSSNKEYKKYIYTFLENVGVVNISQNGAVNILSKNQSYLSLISFLIQKCMFIQRDLILLPFSSFVFFQEFLWLELFKYDWNFEDLLWKSEQRMKYFSKIFFLYIFSIFFS